MTRATFWVSLMLVVFVIIAQCYASPPAITNLRLTAEYPSSSSVQYQLVWDPPRSASAGHYRIRCLRGCEAYTSVQWDTRTPSSKVPTDILLKSVDPSVHSKKGSFVLGVTHVYAQGEEGPSVNITLVIGSEVKSRDVIKQQPASAERSIRDDPASLTTGTTSASANSTTNSTTSSTTGGQLTSGSSSTTDSSSNSTTTTDQLTSGSSTTTSPPTTSTTLAPTSAPTATPTSAPTSAPGSTTITITMTMSGDPAQFDPDQFGNALAESLDVSPSNVKVEVTTSTSASASVQEFHKRADSFTVSARVVYGAGSPHPNQGQVTAALNSSQVTGYLSSNNFTVVSVAVAIEESPTQVPTPPPTTSTTSTDDKSTKHKSHIKGPIIAAIVVPVVVVLVAILILAIMIRVRRRRWERRGIELEQIYKSF